MKLVSKQIFLRSKRQAFFLGLLGILLFANNCGPVDRIAGIKIPFAINGIGYGDSGNYAQNPWDIDLSNAIVLNSPADVARWPVTATITNIDLAMNGVRVDFTKKDGPGSWPDVPFGAPGDSLQYTLWIVISVNGQWYTSGCIQYWRGLDRNGGPPMDFARNWYYDVIRWGAMVGHQPAHGEKVGFFVTAGNARNVLGNEGTIVKERSSIVTMTFP